MKKTVRTLALFVSYCLLFILSSSPALAAVGCYEIIIGGEGAAPIDCLGVYVQNIISLLFPLAGAVALLFLFLGGIKFILSSGDPKAAQGAKSTMTYAVLGLVVILLIYFIFEIIKIATGVDLINSFKVVYP